MKIGIMGAKGSFSEEAGKTWCQKNGVKACDLQYLVTAERVLSALEKGSIARGIFPIENSNGGIVLEAVHAMAKHKFNIESMFEIDVRHNLLVRHGTKASEVTSVASHDQALRQCRMYLKRMWPNVDIQVYADTALAAKDLSEGTLSATTAVIAPKGCAELYDLDILEEGIQDLKFNYTVFIEARKFSKSIKKIVK